MQDISLHILDLAQNSIAAGASIIDIFIRHIPHNGVLTIRLKDNGCGMNMHEAERATNPFYTTRTERKVGFGLPMFCLSAEATGGHVDIKSEKGKGTIVEGILHTNHIDCPPLGRMEDTIAALIACSPDVDIRYTHQYGDMTFMFETGKIRKILKDVPINQPEVIFWIKDYIADSLHEFYGGAQI